MGFFRKDEVSSAPVIRRSGGCAACRLSRTCLHPKMPPTGEGELGVLIVAEAPGADEDKANTQLIGQAGQYLRGVLRELGLDLDKHFRKTNAVCCRPPNNRTPTPLEVECCRANLWEEIRTYEPRVIIPLGGTALQAIVGDRWKKDIGGITRWRGFTIPDRQAKAWVCPTYHPSYLMRLSQKGKPPPVELLLFKQDMARAIDLIQTPLPKWPEKEQERIQVITDKDHILWRLSELQCTTGMMAFDYETTGLKPQAEGHRIVSCAVSTSADSAFAFPFGPSVRDVWVQVLQDPRLRKIAQNLKFEEVWSRCILGTGVSGWCWDTMQASHILDNRIGISSLKFQALVNFGIYDYDSHIEGLLKSNDKKSGNAFNRIDQIPMDELLIYNGMDAMLEYRLAMVQMGMD